MGLTCFLCSRKKENGGLHKIPKNPNTRPAWIAFCKLDEGVDDISKVRICSAHFYPTDYIEPNAKRLGNKMILKPGSVPSILNPDIYPSTFTIVPTLKNLANEVDTELKNPVESSSRQSWMNPCSMQNDGETTPKKQRFLEPRYVGDIKSPQLSTPRRAKRNFALAKRRIDQQREKIRIIQQKNRRLKNKIKNLEQLVNHLRNKNLISENSAENLVTNLPDNIKELISRKLKRKCRTYSPELRRFALTLHFYSASAYNYIRKTWQKLLPHPSTLRQWYSVINGKPGFSQEALSCISVRNQQSPVILNIVLDEMSIRSQTIFANGRFYGGVDMGTDLIPETDNFREATSVLVFMAVGLNGHWKVPLGYFLIDGLSGMERANLFTKCLELINDTGAQVFSVTFDGAPVNLSMCTNLGANFDYYSNNFKPWFNNPLTDEKIWIFWDASHMLKLVRNTLGDREVLSDGNEKLIKWEYLKSLYELQYDEGLHAANKLSRKHIYFQDNRMNVKLAAQVFSESVYNSLKFVNELHIPKFENCMPTANFCLIFNNIFDILNCRNKFSKKNKFNIPVSDNNLQILQTSAEEFENYICSLKDNGTPILKSKRRTGFLGLVICLRNIFELFQKIKGVGQDYLLSFKLSQDHLETFFSCIRSRGGFNNNPNALQFETAYKRLLLRHEISNTYSSNCLGDGVEILHISSQIKRKNPTVIDDQELNWDFFDHDYVSTLWTLTPYVENVVKYIAGFIVHKILNTKSLCHICSKELTTEKTHSLLIKLKNRGSLIFPSEEVCRICTIAEKVFRQNLHLLFNKKNIKQFLILQVFKNVSKPFNSPEMQNHILSDDILDNHQCQLTKLIIDSYLNIRCFHEAKTRSQKDIHIRQKYTKLILFQNQ